MFNLNFTQMNGGYLEVQALGHPRARNNGFIYAHILAAEKKIGRYIEKTEVVHHINKIKEDNSPENLMVFKTGSDHNKFHGGGTLIETEEKYVYRCDYALRKKYIKTPNTVNKNYYNDCPKCGGLKAMKSKFCRKCAVYPGNKTVHGSYHPPFKVDRDRLKQLLPFYTVREIAEKLNCGQTAIREICQQKGWKPMKRKDIYKKSPFQMGLDVESSGNFQLSLFIGM